MSTLKKSIAMKIEAINEKIEKKIIDSYKANKKPEYSKLAKEHKKLLQAFMILA